MSSSLGLLDVKILNRRDEAEGIISLELVPADGGALPSFEAGSHIDVHVGNGLIRQYSLCNDPRESGVYALGILLEPKSRGGSAGIHRDFVVGSKVKVSPPKNNFKLVESAEHSILAGGGIGITPLLAMAWRLHALGASFELHYCTRSLSRTGFKSLLKDAPFADKISLHLDDGDEAQKFKAELVLGSPKTTTHLYACGPGGFMEFITGSADRLGWAKDRVHVEYFGSEVSLSGDAFTVRAAKSGLEMVVPADKTIAQVLKAHGVHVDLSCEAGVCGTCLTSVVEGTPEHRDMYQTQSEKDSNTLIAVCCSRSKTPVLVLDL